MLPNEAQLQYLTKHLFPQKLRKHSSELVLKMIVYVLMSGCSWRNLPENSPPRSTLFYHFKRINDDGQLSKLLLELTKAARRQNRRSTIPTVAIIDSQTVSTKHAKHYWGYDGGKKRKGRKRHFATDSDGNLLMQIITPANMHDSKAAPTLVEFSMELYPDIKIVYADAAYRGHFVNWSEQEYGLTVEITQREGGGGFKLEPFRWVCERTFAWMTHARRLVVDYEKSLNSSFLWIMLRMVQLLTQRLIA